MYKYTLDNVQGYKTQLYSLLQLEHQQLKVGAYDFNVPGSQQVKHR